MAAPFVSDCLARRPFESTSRVSVAGPSLPRACDGPPHTPAEKAIQVPHGAPATEGSVRQRDGRSAGEGTAASGAAENVNRSCHPDPAWRRHPDNPEECERSPDASGRGRRRLGDDGHRPRASDDAGPRLLLRRARPVEERTQHDDDERLRAGLRRRGLGAARLLARVRARQRGGGRDVLRVAARRGPRRRRARSPTSCSWRTRARSPSSPPPSSRARWSSACVSGRT